MLLMVIIRVVEIRFELRYSILGYLVPICIPYLT